LEGTRRVFKLAVIIGEDERQIIADLAHFYEPEEMVGKQVVVVNNLKSGIVHGERSHGKILIVHGEGEINTFITPDRDTNFGASVR
jgi:tRNA-binding EMAP/Myf-like protein